MNKAAILVAGGKGMRMGTSLPKQYLPLAGKPVLMHTLERFFQADPSLLLMLVLPMTSSTGIVCVPLMALNFRISWLQVERAAFNLLKMACWPCPFKKVLWRFTMG